MSDKITTYKGMSPDMTCRGFQFEVGKTYVHEGDVAVCSSGFHACEHPLDVFAYYAPGTSRFFEVEQAGDISKDRDDSKIASRAITIKAEIAMPDYIGMAVKAVIDAAKSVEGHHTTGNQSAASATGYQSAASATGDHASASGLGINCTASADRDGCALHLNERDRDGSILHVWAGITGRDGIKAGVAYILRNGKPVGAQQ